MMTDHGSTADMAGWMMSGMGIIGLVWLLVSLELLVLIVVAIVWLVGRLRGDSPATHGRRSGALDELDARYARGEVDRDTYLQMRHDLEGR
jgi:putative membrane protein